MGEDGHPYITYEVGADTVTKKLGSGSFDNIVVEELIHTFTQGSTAYVYSHEYTIPNDCFLVYEVSEISSYTCTKTITVQLNGTTQSYEYKKNVGVESAGIGIKQQYKLECKAGDIIKTGATFNHSQGRGAWIEQTFYMLNS